ncbi:MAG: choice-of-anchor tandem repeat GloVer-containing protein [Rhizomicrobium sp.]
MRIICWVLPVAIAATTALGLPAAARTESVLYSFDTIGGGFPDGDLLLDKSGALIGTASGSGSRSSPYGQIFMLSPAHTGWKFKTLVAFDGQDGATPMRGLTRDSSGLLYGTTVDGGAYGRGAVFTLRRSGHVWTEAVLYDFQSGAVKPEGPLVVTKGKLYGTAVGGKGTAFELKPSGNSWRASVLKTFNGDDGKYPLGGLLRDPKTGALYGTTEIGCTYSCGNVFELARSGGQWSETVLYSFHCGKDGANPQSTLVEDSSGALYGTTYFGGDLAAGYRNSGAGTVFKLAPSGGGWAETVLYSFSGSDGEYPEDHDGLLLGKDGAFYGTTSEGGDYECGVLFKLVLSRGAVKETVLHSFGRVGDGEYPEGGVIEDAKTGALYGSTFSGGAYGYGTVYRFTQ